MDNVRYTSRRLAEIFGVTPKQVTDALGRRDGFGPKDLPVLRKALRQSPPAFPFRRQLFLNFKGGTGKTSLSTSYAYRLAERGYRVLVIDLDSQGHATRCLGEEGASFPRTLFDVLVRKVPLSQVVIETKMPGLKLVPSNLAMSTVDLALMPLAGREFKLRNALKDVEGEFDFLVMDAPPSFGLLNLNALMAAQDLVTRPSEDVLRLDVPRELEGAESQIVEPDRCQGRRGAERCCQDAGSGENADSHRTSMPSRPYHDDLLAFAACNSTSQQRWCERLAA